MSAASSAARASGASRVVARLTALAALAGGVACANSGLPPLSPRTNALPARLSQADLYADATLTTVRADLVEYAPSFELWSDGAQKRRWIRLPRGAQIDTRDMDAWVFPVGTQLWKEFSFGGRRVETRLLARVAPDDDGWVGLAYVWNDEGTEASAAVDGVRRPRGLAHDVPPARACFTCHGGRASVVLGFSAIQLARAPVRPGDVTLDALAAGRLISSPPPSPIHVPGTDAEAAALGYLHANCGSCHNGARPPGAEALRPPATLDLWLTVGALGSPSATSTYRTVLAQAPPGEHVVPGAPEASALRKRVARSSWFLPRMPPLAVETVDQAGVALLDRWIRGLPAR